MHCERSSGFSWGANFPVEMVVKIYAHPGDGLSFKQLLIAANKSGKFVLRIRLK